MVLVDEGLGIYNRIMGNINISITAEFTSLIKAQEYSRYIYFVSTKSRKIYSLVSKIAPSSLMDHIFKSRIQLSQEFDDFVKNTQFNCAVEFGCGYSLRGFEYCLKNKDNMYIDTDCEDVVKNKKEILEKICVDTGIDFPKNYMLLAVDALEDNVYEKLSSYIVGDKNIFLAEGLTPYFSFEQYSHFIENIKQLLKLRGGVFFSQENHRKDNSFGYKLLRKFVAIMTRNKSYVKFMDGNELKTFIKDKGFESVSIYYKNDILFYKIN